MKGEKKFFRVRRKMLWLIPVLFFFASCIHVNLFEKQVAIPGQQWYYNNVPGFTFQIDDTAASYHVYIVLRHTDLYKYSNIWLRVGAKTPSDSMQYQDMKLTLATDKEGWAGTGMDDIYEVRKSISEGPVRFKTPGEYTFTIAQIMRDNPLSYVLNVGVRIEKAAL